jgi:phage shock protein A
MPYPNYHSARVRDPADFEEGSFRTIRLPKSKAENPDVFAIIGRLKGETTTTIQAYRFPKDQFTPAEAKTWLKDNGVTDYSFEEAAQAQNKLHDALMQTLDRWVNKTYLAADSFAASVDKWNGIPLIFAKDHPDQIRLTKDLLKEIEKIGGRLVGAVADARVETTGHPRLMGQLDFDDAEADKLWQEGRLSLSTAFSCNFDENRRTVGPVEPNHILLFEETPKDQPGDPGTFILNKKQGTGEEEGIELIDKLKRWVARLISNQGRSADGETSEGNGETTMNEKEYEQKLASAAKETEELNHKLASKDAEVGNLRDAIKAKDAEIAKVQGELAEFRAKQADERWAAMKAKCPPGLVHADKEKETRALYEGDKDAFYEKLLSFKQKAGTREEGVAFTAGSGTKPDVDAEFAKMGVPSVEILDKRARSE